MDEIHTVSTSKSTAQATDVVLRETTTTRLIFKPLLVDNPKNPSASVKGDFLFQRKRRINDWEDFETIPLSSLKSGEGYKLELKTEELITLYNEITNLYEIYRQGGVPRGQRKFVQATPQLEQLAKLTDGDVANFLRSNSKIGVDLIAKLLNWAVNLDDPSPLIEKLVELNPESLHKLNAALGLQSLKRIQGKWSRNAHSSDEEFWQRMLREHSFVIEQVFAWPASIIKGKAYIGGKSVNNTGGNIVDFLLRNRLTRNAALVEIKTPATKLLGPDYRSGVPNASSDLSGSVMQILNYRHSLQEQFIALSKGQSDLFDSFDPQCAVIIGNAGSELDHQDKVKAFELFRNQLRGVLIITFDELFDRTQHLIDLLENP